MIRFTVLAVALLVSASTAAAQRACKKGIPCGNTCISASKVCHIDAAPSKATTDSSVKDSTKDTMTKSATTADAWVGSTKGNMYYRIGCSGANVLSPANRVTFKTEIDAQKAGYHRSATKGC